MAKLSTITYHSTPVLGHFQGYGNGNITGPVQFGWKESAFDKHCQTGMCCLPRPALGHQQTGGKISLGFVTGLQKS